MPHPPRFWQIPSARCCMDSLAQELIDEIIKHVPRRDLIACSLVARRWRCRSQQRHFEFVLFTRSNFTRWEVSIPQDSNRIPSYVHHLRFQSTPFGPLEPGTLARVLKTFTSMISLSICAAHLPSPDELAVPVSLGEFRKGITRLAFAYSIALSARITSFVFSFPNLKELLMYKIHSWDEAPPISPNTSWRPLDLLVVWGVSEMTYRVLDQSKLTSRRLSLHPSENGAELLAKSSSKTITELTLIGMQFLRALGKRNLH